jgi:hypothetical protein
LHRCSTRSASGGGWRRTFAAAPAVGGSKAREKKAKYERQNRDGEKNSRAFSNMNIVACKQSVARCPHFCAGGGVIGRCEDCLHGGCRPRGGINIADQSACRVSRVSLFKRRQKGRQLGAICHKAVERHRRQD